MKNLFVNVFSFFGLVVYAIFSVIIRIPVAIFLLAFIAFYLLLITPITRGSGDTPNWLGKLYDWYRGK